LKVIAKGSKVGTRCNYRREDNLDDFSGLGSEEESLGILEEG